MSPTRPDHLDRPHVSRLSPGHPSFERIVARHRAAVDDGAETYVDPATGYRVFTAARLAARGTCCDTGCRHCPYVGA